MTLTPPTQSSGLVALVFTDLVGSTALMNALGDDEAELVRRTHFQLLRQVLGAHRGHEVKNLGDGLMVVFESVLDAVGSAVAMQQVVERYNRSAGTPLGVRIGIHIGEPIVDESDYFGTPVVVAKRLCDRADGGQILASRLVRDLVGGRGGHEFSDVGALELKGFAEPVPVLNITWHPDSTNDRPDRQERLPQALTGEVFSFIGREQELEVLGAAWERARAGTPQLVLIGGEPGIGKTSLAAFVARQASDAGATVLFGRCDENALVPYQPFVEALTDRAVAVSSEDLAGEIEGRADVLARLVPELQRSVTMTECSPTGESESDRYRLFEAVSRWVGRIASDGVLFVVDDLHWADASSLLMLRHLARHSRQAPVMIVATYRDTDVTPLLADALADFRREAYAIRIALGGLSEREVIRLVTHQAPDQAGEMDRDLARGLWAETEGNPLFIRELLRHLLETGGVTEVDGRWTLARPIGELGIPEGLRELIGRRLARLSDPANTCLRVAAVIGREFDAALLEHACALDGDRVIDALEEALAARLIYEASTDRYTFSHAVVRETLYGELSGLRRRRLHRQVAAAIEGLDEGALDTHLASLAYHLFEAGGRDDAARGVQYARRAGVRAMRQLAYEEASRLFALALQAGEDLESDDGDRADLLLALGEAQWRAGDGPGGRASCERAAGVARRLGDARRLARAAVGYAGAGVRVWWVDIGDSNEVLISLLEEALPGLSEEDELRARVLGCLAKELYFTPGTNGRREDLSREAVDLARRLADPGTLTYALAARNHAVFGPDTLSENLSQATEMVDLGERFGDLEALAHGRAHRAQALFYLGDVEGALCELELGALLGDELRQPSHSVIVLLGRITAAAIEGRLHDIEAMALELYRTGREIRDPNIVLFFGVTLFCLRREQGRLAEIIGSFPGFADRYPAIPAWEAVLVGSLAELGLLDQARARFDVLAADNFAAFPRDYAWLAAMCLLGEACAVFGDADRARTLYDALLPYATLNVLPAGPFGCLGPAAGFLGLLAGAMGRWEDASGHFEAALDLARRMGIRPAEARFELYYARMLAARGRRDDVEAAIAHLGVAGRLADSLGLGAVRVGAAALRNELVGQSREDGNAMPLTIREHARATFASTGRSALVRLTRNTDDQRLERRFGGLSQRALMSAVARSFQPRLAFGFRGEIAFELTGIDEPEWWTVGVDGTKATPHRGRGTNPAVIVHIGVADFVRMLSGELHPVAALIDERIDVEGDVALGARLAEMFGAPLPYEIELPALVPGRPDSANMAEVISLELRKSS